MPDQVARPAQDRPEIALKQPAFPLAVPATPSGDPQAAVSISVASSARDSDIQAQEAAKAQFLWHTHDYVHNYARFSDTKAAFTGAVASALLGVLYTAKVHIPVISSPVSQWSLAIWLTVVSAVLLVAVVGLSMFVVWPRLRSTQQQGFIYWGGIAAHGSVDGYQRAFVAQSGESLNQHLLHHLYDVSEFVLIPKLRLISIAVITLALGASSAVAALLLSDVPRAGGHTRASPSSAVSTIDPKPPLTTQAK